MLLFVRIIIFARVVWLLLVAVGADQVMTFSVGTAAQMPTPALIQVMLFGGLFLANAELPVLIIVKIILQYHPLATHSMAIVAHAYNKVLVHMMGLTAWWSIRQ